MQLSSTCGTHELRYLRTKCNDNDTNNDTDTDNDNDNDNDNDIDTDNDIHGEGGSDDKLRLSDLFSILDILATWHAD